MPCFLKVWALAGRPEHGYLDNEELKQIAMVKGVYCAHACGRIQILKATDLPGGNAMGCRQCQGIHRLRHREQPLEALGWRHRQRELLKNASTGVVDQHHQQRRTVLCGVKPTIAVMQQSQITADQDQWPRR